MTGYGRATGETAVGRITVEVRSLNHRHLDVMLRAPRGMMHMDPEIRNMVRERVSRGKVEMYLILEDRLPEFYIDTDRAVEIAGSLEKIAVSIGDTVRLEHILAAAEITKTSEKEIGSDTSAVVLETARLALERLVEHRFEEGKALSGDLKQRMAWLKDITDDIARVAPEVPERVRQNMRQFLTDLLGGRDE